MLPFAFASTSEVLCASASSVPLRLTRAAWRIKLDRRIADPDFFQRRGAEEAEAQRNTLLALTRVKSA